MEETLVFIDEGFLDKLLKLFGDGKRIKFDKFDFAKRITKKQNLLCKHLFYYTCPPFQSDKPTEEETKRKKGYDKFISALSKNKDITIREGILQKIVDEKGKLKYNQKGVDTLLTIDLGHIRDDFPDINKIILVSSDTDFCPAIRDIEKRDKIEVILYTYFDRKRKSKFSLSNELIDCCSEHIKLTKEDFTSCPIDKERNK
jgi:uncharacterized LabA/DUF88 family protein